MYPVYFALINAALTLVIGYRRKVLKRLERPGPVGRLPALRVAERPLVREHRS